MTVLVLLGLTLTALPSRIDVPTSTAGLASAYELAIDEGKLWWRPRGSSAAFTLLPPDGLPVAKPKTPPFTPPRRVDALSADGNNLVAWGSDGHVYYTKLDTLEWTEQWGPVGDRAVLSVKGLDALAMSHRMIPYEDIDGNVHPVDQGVTTFYALAEGGRSLRYADPWLPPHFERRLCLPERNQFVAAGLSASASTIFVMDRSGRSFTRLADFDTVGDDPLLSYSWVREKRAGLRAEIRSLPGEPWRAQPRITGWHSTHLAILQTGPTNAARELRVQGQDGYWHKPIFAESWSFTATPPVDDPGLPTDGEAPRQPLADTTLTAPAGWPGTKLTLKNFNPLCSPATLVITSKKETLELELDFHGGLDLVGPTLLKGTLVLPAGKGGWLGKLKLMAAGASHLDVQLELVKDAVILRRQPFVDVRFPRPPAP
jgi:hypothetical protein